MPQPLNPDVFESFRSLQAYCGDNAAESGWDDNATEAEGLFAELRASGKSTLADYLEGAVNSQTFMLVSDELSEANDELRKGRAMTEEYFNGAPGKELKPEGIPSELADVIIRVLHIAAFHKIDLATTIKNKLAFNRTRGIKHGGLKF